MTSQPQLARFLPPDSSIEKRDDDSFDFTVVKDIGITTVKLSGTLTVTPTDTPDELRFLATAKHVVGGTAVIDLVIRFEGTQAHCDMTYTGTADATGLVGKFLSMGEAKVQGRLDTMFADFGHRLARSQRVSDTPIA